MKRTRRENRKVSTNMRTTNYCPRLRLAGVAVTAFIIGGCTLQPQDAAAPPPSPGEIKVSRTGIPQIPNPITAPPIGKLKTLDGETVSMESLRGKVVILDFWATWCGPCRMTIPVLQELHKKHGKDGLVVIGISDEPGEVVKPFVGRGGMDYRIVADPDTKMTWGANYEVESLPTMAVIDRNGKLRMYEKGFDRTPGRGTIDRLNEIVPQLLTEK